MLENTYNIFFGQFPELTEIQQLVIPKIDDGDNILVVSSTASGKTEAVIAPVCEKLICEDVNKDQLLVVYIIPTIALANDLVIRVKEKIEKSGFSVGIRTSDDRNFNLKNPQNFLFTTPESLDYLICRFSNLLKKLRYVIIDELHFLDNSYRGDQLRILLERIKDNLEKDNVSICAMSATINEPEKMIKRYMKNGQICKTEGNRNITFIKIDTRKYENYLEHIRKVCDKYFINHQKFLIFCNTKKEVIQLISELKNTYHDKQLGIFEHHASLSRQERKNVEDNLQRNSFGICVCTNTLELGIDIGDIDAVMLKNPPPTISSMLQRVGRSNRRTKNSICICIYDNDEDESIFSDLIGNSIKGNIEKIQYIPDISVTIQQILSMAYQNHYNYEEFLLTKEKILELLKPFNLRNEIILKIINWLKNEKLFLKIQRKGDLELILPDTELLNIIERDPRRIHSNIPDNFLDIPVYDQNNKLIGNISPPTQNMHSFNLGSKKWEIVSIENKKINVKQVEKSGGIPSFYYNKFGYFKKFLPDEIKENIKSGDMFMKLE